MERGSFPWILAWPRRAGVAEPIGSAHDACMAFMMYLICPVIFTCEPGYEYQSYMYEAVGPYSSVDETRKTLKEKNIFK